MAALGRFPRTRVTQGAVSFIRHFSGTAANRASLPTVGFIGLGLMGNHMARNLMKKGYPVMVYDISKEAMDTMISEGAKGADNPAHIAASTNKIITMLPESPHVQEVYCGKDGIYNTVQSGSLLIDSSTIDPSVAQEMAEIGKQKGSTYLDAPVSGGVNAARAATLTFMVGGSEQGFAQAKELLDHLGKNVVHCGATGCGQSVKICNNMLLGVSMIGTSETMNLGIKLGLDPKILAKVINMSTGRCWSCETYNPVPGVVDGVPSSDNYKGGFGTALMTKDLGIAQNAATATKCPTPLGSAAHQMYRLMCNHGYGLKDFSVAFQFIQDHTKKT